MQDNRCVVCGTTIPEGRQCCPSCERRVKNDEYSEGRGSVTQSAESGGEKQSRDNPSAHRLLPGLALRVWRGGVDVHGGKP